MAMRRQIEVSGSMFLLVAGLAGCGRRDDTSAPRDDQTKRSALMSAVTAFKAAHPPAAVATDDNLGAQFRTLVLAAEGLDAHLEDRNLDARLAAAPKVAATLSADQVAAWRALNKAAHGNGAVTWDDDRGTPAFIELGLTFKGATPKAAEQELTSRAAPLLARMFGLGAADALVTVSDTTTTAAERGDEAPTTRSITQQRKRNGLPVFGDWYQLTIRTSDWAKDAWVAAVQAHWSAGLDRIPTTPLVRDIDAVAMAQAAGDVPKAWLAATPELGYFGGGTKADLSWRISLANDAKQSWLYYVSAISGSILESANQVADNSGSVSINVGLPQQGTTKSPHPLPYAYIYEDERSQHENAGCGFANGVTHTVGDTSQQKGYTSYYGGYFDNALTVFDPADLTWAVDYRGLYAYDATDAAVMSRPFTAWTNTTLPQETADKQSRRGEIFFHLTYGSILYISQGLSVYTPTNYYLYTRPSSGDCPAPPYNGSCCAGTSAAGCIEVDCDSDFGTVSSDYAERRFREIVYHEQQHNLRYKASGSLCGGCTGTASTDGTECACWEEGRADFAALGVGHFEKARPEFRPNRHYPGDYVSGDNYASGSIWTSIYIHHLLSEGVPGIYDVSANTQMIDSATRMVGNCTGSDVSTCPANSFYRYLINNNAARVTGDRQSPNEISEIFHWHVWDANRAVAGSQTFPWADELPNRFLTSPFVKSDGPSPIFVSYGPSGAGQLKLNKPDDYDTVMFYGEAGKTYTIQTDSLAAGVDTMLQIFTFVGTKINVLASNDDCAAPARYSCVSFAPSSTGYYRARVNPYPNTVTGQGATYRLWIQMVNDDYGDTIQSASALPPSAAQRASYGQMNSGADADVFKITSATAQTVTYGACMSGGTMKAEILDSSGALVQWASNASCPMSGTALSIGAGTFYLRLTSSTFTTGAYTLLMNLSNGDLDINSTPANAFTLTSDSAGKTYGSRFESGADIDWYKFSAVGGQFYHFETYAMEGAADTVIEVYAPSTTVYGRTGTIDSLPDYSGAGLGDWMLETDDSTLASLGSRVAFMAPATGTYYIKVMPYDGDSIGSYQVMFEDTGSWVGWPDYP